MVLIEKLTTLPLLYVGVGIIPTCIRPKQWSLEWATGIDKSNGCPGKDFEQAKFEDTIFLHNYV